MERVIGVLRKPVSNVGEAAFLLGLFTFISQLLGLLRDRLLAGVFGAGKELDIYYAAFRFPDLIFVTVASLVAMSVLIPYLADAKTKGKEFFDTLVSDLFLCFSFAIVIVCGIVFFLLPTLISHAFSGFSPNEIAKVVLLSRIILFSPIFLGFSNLLGSVAQVYGRFVSYAIAPALYNLGIILGTILLVPYFGVFGVAVGVAVGALLHVTTQATSLSGIVSLKELLGFREKLGVAFKRINKIVWISIPRTIALSSSNLALLGLMSIGSFLGAGAISAFTFGNNLQAVTVSIIGVSFAMAAFPVLSNLFRAGELVKMRQELINTARKIVFFTVPAACFLIVFRAHLVRIILGSGHFNWEDTRLVAASLAIFSISLAFQSLYHLFIRTLYAMGDNKKSFYSSISGAISMVVVAFVWYKWSLVNPLPSEILNSLLKVSDVPGTQMLALPIGFAFGAIVECLLLWVIVERKISFTKNIIKPVFQSVGAGIIGAASSYEVLQYTGKFFVLDKFVGLAMHAFIGGVVGLLVTCATLVLLGNEEVRVLLQSFTRRFSGIKPIAADTDVLS